MSHSPPSYMDGVPVKISERFKPPPKIALPQGVVNRLAQYDANQVLRDLSYEFELEDTVLKRITEWKAVREKERYERTKRLQAKEQERLRLIEAEQKRKLHQISYPNTDDLSSASEGDGEDDGNCSEENDESVPSGSSDEHGERKAKPFDHMKQYDTILIPTIMPGMTTVGTVSTNIFASKGTPNDTSIPKTTAIFNNNNNNNNNSYNKINYSDFENDTSSPFDNMELRTINDLDILAQVLKLNSVVASGTINGSTSTDESEKESPKDVRDEKAEEVQSQQSTNPAATEPPSVNSPPPQQPYAANYGHTQYPIQQSFSQQYQHPSQTAYGSYQYGYQQYAPSSTTASVSCYGPTNLTDNHYLSQYTSATYVSPNAAQQQPYPAASTSYSPYYPYNNVLSSATSGTGTGTSGGSTTQANYAHNYPYTGGFVAATGYGYPPTSVTPTPPAAGPSPYSAAQDPSPLAGLKSKSKSVPDIVRQLDDEVQDSALRRTRNNSQSISDRQHPEMLAGGSATTPTSAASLSSAGVDYTQYNQLSLADQNVVKRISSMGFPMERVITVLQRIGGDDKKIIEHLIPLSELLDLGFEESKISEALLKFGNNKHKALDYLIS